MGAEGFSPDWPSALDDGWRDTRERARVSSHALVAPWVSLSPGVIVHPFALVGHLASRSKALAHPGTPTAKLTVGRDTEIGPHTTIYGGATIGAGCLIGDGASIREGVTIGDRCIIGRNVTINFGATIGDDVRIMDGSFVAEGCRIGDGSLLGAGVVMSGDAKPDLANYRHTTTNAPIIEEGCLIGSGANLLPGVRIGIGAVVGAGAVVTTSVPPGWRAVGPKATVSYTGNGKRAYLEPIAPPPEHHPV